jgi:uncharacterized paraquat-inducible protein A
MKLTAALLSLLIAIAPWSGVVAQWMEEGQPSAPELATGHQASTPCHSHVEMQTPSDDTRCPNCGNSLCELDSCKCAGSVAGLIAPSAQLSLPGVRGFHAAYRQQATSFEPIPDSPPPIA